MKYSKTIAVFCATGAVMGCEKNSSSELQESVPIAEKYVNTDCSALDMEKYFPGQTLPEEQGVGPTADELARHRPTQLDGDGLCGKERDAVKDALAFRSGDFVKAADNLIVSADILVVRIQTLTTSIDNLNAQINQAKANNDTSKVTQLESQKATAEKQIESLKNSALTYYRQVKNPIDLILGSFLLKDGTGVTLGKWSDCSYQTVEKIEGALASEYSTRDLKQSIAFRACEGLSLVSTLQDMAKNQNAIYGATRNNKFSSNKELLEGLARGVKSTLFSYSEKANQRILMLTNGNLNGLRFQDVSILATLGEPGYFIDRMQKELNNLDSRIESLQNKFVSRDNTADSDADLSERKAVLENELNSYSSIGAAHSEKKDKLDNLLKALDKKIADAELEKGKVLDYVGKSFEERFVGRNGTLSFPKDPFVLEPFDSGLDNPGADDVFDITEFSAIEVTAPNNAKVRANGIYYGMDDMIKETQQKLDDAEALLGATTYMLNRPRPVPKDHRSRDRPCRNSTMHDAVCAKVGDRNAYGTAIVSTPAFQQNIREAFAQEPNRDAILAGLLVGHHDYFKYPNLFVLEQYLTEKTIRLKNELVNINSGNGNPLWAQAYMQDTDLSGYKFSINAGLGFSAGTSQGTSISGSLNGTTVGTSNGTSFNSSSSIGTAVSRSIYSDKALYPKFPVGSLIGVMEESCAGAPQTRVPVYIGLRAYIFVPKKAGCTYRIGFVINDQVNIKLKDGRTVLANEADCSLASNNTPSSAEDKSCFMMHAPITLNLTQYKSAQTEFAKAMGIFSSLKLEAKFATIASNDNPIRLGVEYVKGELRKEGVKDEEIIRSMEPIVEAFISQKLMESKVTDLENQRTRLQVEIKDEELAASLAENRHKTNEKISSILATKQDIKDSLKNGYQQLIDIDLADLESKMNQIFQWQVPLLKSLKYHQFQSTDRINALQKKFDDLQNRYLTARKSVIQVSSFDKFASFKAEINSFRNELTNLKDAAELKWIVHQSTVGHCELSIDPSLLFSSLKVKDQAGFDPTIAEALRSNNVSYNSYFALPFNTVIDSNGGALDCKEKLNNVVGSPKILALTLEWNEAASDSSPIGGGSSASNKPLLEKGLSEVYLKRENRMWWKGKYNSQYYLLSQDDFDQWVQTQLGQPIYSFVRTINSIHSSGYDDPSCRLGTVKNLAQLACIKKLSGELFQVSNDSMSRNPSSVQTLFANTLIESDWNLIVPNKNLGDLGSAADAMKIHVFYYVTQLK